MSLTITIPQLLRLRLWSQGLLRPAGPTNPSPMDVVQRIFAAQAQELSAGLLSIGTRGGGQSVSAVDQARQTQRSLVWTWCLRGTLHLITADDAAWLLPLVGPNLIAASRRRLFQLGWDAERLAKGLRLLGEALPSAPAGLTRAEIAGLLAQNSLPSTGQAPVHLLYRAGLEGLLCRGADRGKEPTYVWLEDWIGKLHPLPREEALARLARRYLNAYAPATPADLAAWAGLSKADANLGWQAVAGEMTGVEGDGQAMWMLDGQSAWLASEQGGEPIVNLLPRFDTYLLGYASRNLILDPAFVRRINAGGGIIHASLLVDGRIRGTWRMKRSRNELIIVCEPFQGLSADQLSQVQSAGEDLGRFLNAVTTRVDIPAG